MRELGPVDLSNIDSLLSECSWLPAGDPGTFAMISRPTIETLPRVIDVVSSVMAQYFPGRTVGRMLALSRLTPGQFIEPHTDRHDAHCPVRVHVPLITNPSVVFVSEKRALHMRAGRAYVIDPTKPHCVANGGDTDRVHLFWNVVGDAVTT